MFVKIAWSKNMPKRRRKLIQQRGEVLRKLSEEIGVNIFAMQYVLIFLNSPNNSVQ